MRARTSADSRGHTRNCGQSLFGICPQFPLRVVSGYQGAGTPTHVLPTHAPAPPGPAPAPAPGTPAVAPPGPAPAAAPPAPASAPPGPAPAPAPGAPAVAPPG